MEEKERKELTKMIGKKKRIAGELDIIEQCITKAFEAGRIEETDYYNLLLKCKEIG